MKKILSAIVSMVLLAGLFTGCSTEETALYQAIKKTMALASYESKTNITSTLDVVKDMDRETLDYYDRNAFDSLESMLDGAGAGIETKVASSGPLPVKQFDTKLHVDAMDLLSLQTEFWGSIAPGVRGSVSGTLKLPALYRLISVLEQASSGAPVTDTEYWNLNFGEGINVNAILESGSAITKRYQEAFLPGFQLVKETAQEEEDTLYHVSISDYELKRLLFSIADDFFNQQEVRTLYHTFATTLLRELGREERIFGSEADVDAWFADLENNLVYYRQMVTGVLYVLNGVPILGENGITIDYTVDKDGYMIQKKWDADLRLDMAALEMFSHQLSGDVTPLEDREAYPVYAWKLSGATEYSNLNGPVEITMPTVTEDNAYHPIAYLREEKRIREAAAAQVSDWNALMAEIEQNGLPVSYKNGPLETKAVIRPIVGHTASGGYSGNLYYPLREIASVLGGTVTWDASTRCVLFVVGEKTYRLDLNEKLVYTNGKLGSTFGINGFHMVQDTVCIALSQAEYIYGATIALDAANCTLLINK